MVGSLVNNLTFGATMGIVMGACGVGLIWAGFNWFALSKIRMELRDDEAGLIEDPAKVKEMASIGEKIATGAKEFLMNEYLVCGIFVVIMFIGVTFMVSVKSGITFLVGAFTSMVCGAVGMLIATYSNYRTTFTTSHSLAEGFRTAYRAGCVMGFALVSISLFVLALLIIIYDAVLATGDDHLKTVFEAIAGYGLGGSTVALFGRVGGGIYTKAADVGADLVGKVEKNLAEDSPRNPATIADNVGDNVGDIAGMGADLFGSFAESTCAALVISSDSLIPLLDGKVVATDIAYLMYPLLSSGVGILACILTSVVGIYLTSVDE